MSRLDSGATHGFVGLTELSSLLRLVAAPHTTMLRALADLRSSTTGAFAAMAFGPVVSTRLERGIGFNVSAWHLNPAAMLL
mmetsp:Transcript_119024/g.296977  ORF Transcript_119024/g.296977 Transcript_119024/m.296977 type:complete len:81 (+) Transcript_119024:166-408(+)